MDTAGRGVQSIEIGGRLLSVMAVAGRPLMLRDIAGGAGMQPTKAHAYLVSFRRVGLVEQDRESGLYQLGPFALQLGLARLRSLDAMRITATAVAALATELELMVTVTVWGSFGATIVQVQEGTDQVHVNARAGAVYSLTGTATGLVFAAFLPKNIVERHVNAELRDEAGSRIGDHRTPQDRFNHDMAETKRLGYAIATGSPIPGINAISAPVFDHTGQVQVAVTLIGPAGQLDVGPASAMLQRLLAFTAGLSAQLGHNGSPTAGEQSVRQAAELAHHPIGASKPRATRKRRAASDT